MAMSGERKTAMRKEVIVKGTGTLTGSSRLNEWYTLKRAKPCRLQGDKLVWRFNAPIIIAPIDP